MMSTHEQLLSPFSSDAATSDSEGWDQFLQYAKGTCSAAAFENWLAPIRVMEAYPDHIVLAVPNPFVKEYLIDNYKNDLCAFLPVRDAGEPAVDFVITPPVAIKRTPIEVVDTKYVPHPKLNQAYRFENFIEGPSNQFAKSAAMGVATRPGRSYNPLFIHGGVGLGKTHILHSIGNHIKEHHKKLKIESITTEEFCNDLVDSLRNKSIDQLKKRYRESDIFLLDDVQFLQSRLNFEEELCNTFESLLQQNKQIVITSDKPPVELKLSERLVARMEWGLVVHVGTPELETRVAILQHKAEQKGMQIPTKVLFFIAEHIYSNVRQLEGAINKLSAQCKLFNLTVNEESVEAILKGMLQRAPKERITVDDILKSVADVFQVSVLDIKGNSRTKEVVLPRQVAMYLAREMINESLMMLGAYFSGRTHSTLLHACKNVEKRVATDEILRHQMQRVRQSIEY